MSNVDLLVVFKAQASKEDVQQASDEYARLLKTLRDGGLQVTGKRGAKRGELLVFVHCSDSRLVELAREDAARAFVHGLLSSRAALEESHKIMPSDRGRLVHTYICSSKHDGGLGITPEAPEWDRVTSVFILHDQKWNDKWIKAWTTELDVSKSLDQLRAQFGESLAMYFAFLSFYMRSLVPPALLGISTFVLFDAFDPLYSVLLLIWSVGFVEWWSITERKLSVRWGVRGASRVEILRAGYNPQGDVWWKKELKTIASIPIITAFAGALVALMTALFVFEAFVTQLYDGPGKQHIGLVPTILFVLLVPRLLGFYQTIAVRLTRWENHPRQSSYDRSLTLKTFALAALVAYGGLSLSAFVYAPFGIQIMHHVQAYLAPSVSGTYFGKFLKFDSADAPGAVVNAIKIDRLKGQVFAFTVTNQFVNFAQEVVIPWVLESVEGLKSKGQLKVPGVTNGNGKKKRVEWEDESASTSLSREDRLLLDAARTESALPDYQLFGDYSEMITQFGYVVLWSTVWPLAPLMALVNNWIELRSDAYKIAKLGRKPLPSRTDTIGAWATSLSFITWLGALTNAALIYLFNPRKGVFAPGREIMVHPAHEQLEKSTTAGDNVTSTTFTSSSSISASRTHSIMLTATLVALLASHGYILARAIVRHVLERALWAGSVEEKMMQEREVEAREARLKAATIAAPSGGNSPSDSGKKDAERVANNAVDVSVSSSVGARGLGVSDAFWVDQGMDEISNAAKLE